VTPEELAVIKAGAETALGAVHRGWPWPEIDNDLVIGASLKDVPALVAEVEQLRGALEAARRPHLGSEYDEYACPLGHGAEYVTDATGQCTCGASEHNARIDAALSCEDPH
jgi:hypothetical protein